MTDKSCMRCFVSGTVQGVWYRASTQEEAEKLGLQGWARNLDDGRVEVFACGATGQLELLYEWLKEGPPLANVTDVSHDTLPWQECTGFDTF